MTMQAAEDGRLEQLGSAVSRALRKAESARVTGFPVPAADYQRVAEVAEQLLEQLQSSCREGRWLRKELQAKRLDDLQTSGEDDGEAILGSRLRAWTGNGPHLKLLQQEQRIAQQEELLSQQRATIRSLEREVGRVHSDSPILSPRSGQAALHEARTKADALQAANCELAAQLVEAKAAAGRLEAMVARNEHISDELQRVQRENGLLRNKLHQLRASYSAMAVANALESAPGAPASPAPPASGSQPGSSPRPKLHRAAGSQPAAPSSPGTKQPPWDATTGSGGCSSSPGRQATSPRRTRLQLLTELLDDGCSEEADEELAFVGRAGAQEDVNSAYCMRRVGGGFVPQPRSPGSGQHAVCSWTEAEEEQAMARSRLGRWVPKAAVSLMQEFKRRHAARVRWSHCEALLLLLDEAFRQRATEQLAELKAVNSKLSKALARKVAQSRSYPAVVYDSKLSFLQQQLASAQQALSSREGGRRSSLAHLAEQGLHMGRQLDWTLEENLALRSDLAAAEEAGTPVGAARVSLLLLELGGRVDRAGARLSKQLQRAAGTLPGVQSRALHAAAATAICDIREGVERCREQAVVLLGGTIRRSVCESEDEQLEGGGRRGSI